MSEIIPKYNYIKEEIMSEEANIIAKIGIDTDPPAKEPIFISLSSYMNKKYVDIRKYYKDSTDSAGRFLIRILRSYGAYAGAS